MSISGSLRTRNNDGNTPVSADWGSNSEYGVMRDVLLGPPETFHWMEDYAEWSSVVRDTLADKGVGKCIRKRALGWQSALSCRHTL